MDPDVAGSNRRPSRCEGILVGGLLPGGSEMSPLRVATPLAPLVDHHQHLLSPMLAGRVFESGRGQEPVTADRLIAQLDAAGIQRAAVLSLAYMHGSPSSMAFWRMTGRVLTCCRHPAPIAMPALTSTTTWDRLT
jgi:hypothetical protein